MEQPFLNGSVLEPLILTSMQDGAEVNSLQYPGHPSEVKMRS